MTQIVPRTLAYAEDAAFALQRSLPTDNVGVDELISLARRLISEAIDTTPDVEELDSSSWESQNRRKLDSAARIICSLAERAEEDVDVQSSLLLLSALAFGLDGNHAAARLLGHTVLRAVPLGDSRLVALGVACPLMALACAARCEGYTEAQAVLLAAHGRIAQSISGANQIVDLLKLYEQRLRTPGLGYLLGLSIRSLEVAEGLRFDAILSAHDFPLKPNVLASLQRNERFLALPSQRAALQTPGVLSSFGSALVTLPTGAGKTLVGLLSLATSLREESDVAVFLAPYLAIRRQVEDAAAALFGGGVNVVSGGRGVPESHRPSLLVDTPERFDWRLRHDPRIRNRVRAIVYDEAHLLGSDARGLLADAVLSRMRLGSTPERAPRLVLLSAVLDEDDEVLSWLAGSGESTRATSRWRPAARRIGIWRPNGQLDWIRVLGIVSGRRGIRTIASGFVQPVHPVLAVGDPRAGSGQRWAQGDANAARLAVSLNAQAPECTLIVVGTRARARSLARVITALAKQPDTLSHGRAQLTSVIRDQFPLFSDLVPMVARGVAYHSALLPVVLRHAIERVCVAGELDYVCATTSLAEGSDLPFGRCILADWTFPYGVGRHRAFPPSLWRNIAGRCGRPSTHIEGETIVIEDTPPVAFASLADRRTALREMMTGFVRIESSLGQLEEEAFLVQEQLVSQAIATIAENPLLDEAPSVLVDRLLSSRLARDQRAMLAKDYLEDRLVSGDVPLAIRNSPLALSAVGRAFLRCPVMPGTAEMILRLLRSDAHIQDPEMLCARVLRACARAAELVRTPLAKIVSGSRVNNLWVREADLTLLCQQWLLGTTVQDILRQLAARPGRSTKKEQASLDAWLAGVAEPEAWLPRYEKLLEFMRTVFADFLPRALTTVRHLSQELSLGRDWAFDLDALIRDAAVLGRQLRESDDA